MKTLRYCLFWALISPAFLRSLPEQFDRQQGGRETAIRQEEAGAFVAELLYLTSSLTNIFSDEVFFLNSVDHGLRIFNQKVNVVDPGYNFGGSLAFLYRAPLSRNDLKISYSYIHNQAKEHLIRDVSDEAFGIIQRNRQNDWGALHTHLHIFDLLVGHSFPFYDYLLLKFAGGLTVDDFHYFFSFKNDDVITNTSVSTGQETAATLADVLAERKFRFCGWGPKVGLRFGYHFLPNDSRHEVALYSSFEFSLLFSKRWGKGGYRGQVTTRLEGVEKVSPAFPLKWRDDKEAQIVPHMHLDFSTRYRYFFPKGGSISLIVGFRALAYWDLDEVNRVINYNLETLTAISPRAASSSDSMIFAGPYASVGVAF